MTNPRFNVAMNTDQVNHFEVIDHSATGHGRCLVRYNTNVEVVLQDQERTLKVFLTDIDIPDIPEVREL